jgi:hypothetical protein
VTEYRERHKPIEESRPSLLDALSRAPDFDHVLARRAQFIVETLSHLGAANGREAEAWLRAGGASLNPFTLPVAELIRMPPQWRHGHAAVALDVVLRVFAGPWRGAAETVAGWGEQPDRKPAGVEREPAGEAAILAEFQELVDEGVIEEVENDG